MAELSTIARPYAEALFAAARSTPPADSVETWAGALDALAAVTAHPQVAAAVADPKLDPARAFELVAGLLSAPLPAGVANFLHLAIANDRLAAVPAVAQQFRRLKHAAAGVADCRIETAFPLDEHQLDQLLDQLGRRFQARLQPQIVVDPALIGGVRVTVGDQVLDGSVRGRLADMRAALTA